MNFHQFDHQFCEANLYEVEYANTISSLFITFIGLNGMRQGHSTVTFLYAALAVNGVTSAMYHYYNTIGWGLMDRMSMILIAHASFILFLNPIGKILTYEKMEKHSINIGKGIHLFAVLYFTSLMTAAGLHHESFFNLLFGVFLFFLPCMMYYLAKHQKKLKLPVRLVAQGKKGIVYIAFSGIFWILTENLCSSVFFVKYLYGHVWWHLGVSYGGYLLSLIPAYIFLQQHLNVQLRYDNFGIPYLSYYRSFGLEFV